MDERAVCSRRPGVRQLSIFHRSIFRTHQNAVLITFLLGDMLLKQGVLVSQSSELLANNFCVSEDTLFSESKRRDETLLILCGNEEKRKGAAFEKVIKVKILLVTFCLCCSTCEMLIPSCSVLNKNLRLFRTITTSSVF